MTDKKVREHAGQRAYSFSLVHAKPIVKDALKREELCRSIGRLVAQAEDSLARNSVNLDEGRYGSEANYTSNRGIRQFGDSFEDAFVPTHQARELARHFREGIRAAARFAVFDAWTAATGHPVSGRKLCDELFPEGPRMAG
jgi:predicted nucleic acid-binding protein